MLVAITNNASQRRPALDEVFKSPAATSSHSSITEMLAELNASKAPVEIAPSQPLSETTINLTKHVDENCRSSKLRHAYLS